MQYILSELAQHLDLKYQGLAETAVFQISSPDNVLEKSIVYLESTKFLKDFNASIALAKKSILANINPQIAKIIIPDAEKNPKKYFLKLLSLFDQVHNKLEVDQILKKEEYPPSWGQNNIISKTAKLGKNTVLMGMNYIGEQVQIGDNCILYPGVQILDHSQVGDNNIFHPGVIIGADGFGFENLNGSWTKVPQIGRVIIGSNCEVGANSTIDRATIGATVIEDGVKIDNLVQIAHNCKIGEGSVIVSMSGIGGSSQLGKGVILGGQVGIADHVVIGDYATLLARSTVMSHKTIPGGKKYGGDTILPMMDYLKRLSAMNQLPKLYQK